MEILISAIMGELMTRSINFVINKWSKPPALAVEQSLQMALFQAQVIDEEAMGRCITNRAMIQQLGMLRDTMHQGYYALDVFRYQPNYGEDGNDLAASRSMSLSKVRSAKDPYFFSRTSYFRKQLQEARDRLSSIIVDMNELEMFLASYPRLYRQPYNMHILLGNCMFGRQVEAELVTKFLLHTKPHSSQEMDVLPIVGPPRVGKSTLVAHVCKDERVQNYFLEILWLHNHDFRDDDLAFRQGYAMKHQNQVSNSNKGKRVLVVIELNGNLNEVAWSRLYLCLKQSFCNESKIIVTSRSDNIIKVGTAQALTLKHLSHEAYWYFFKTLTFGGMDPKTRPRLAQLAMEIARTQKPTIISAWVISYLLRSNFDIHFWCKILSFWRGFIQKHVSKFGVHPSEFLDQNIPLQFGRMVTPSEDLMLSQYCHSSHGDVPEIRAQDVVYGSIKPPEKFEMLVWRAHIPPYHSYVCSCELRERKATGAKRKRSTEVGVTFC